MTNPKGQRNFKKIKPNHDTVIALSSSDAPATIDLSIESDLESDEVRSDTNTAINITITTQSLTHITTQPSLTQEEDHAATPSDSSTDPESASSSDDVSKYTYYHHQNKYHTQPSLTHNRPP